MEDTCRLALAVTNKECLFFLCTDTTGKFTGNVGRQVKYTVVQQFLRNLDCCSQLICGKRCLTECIIGERILLLLVHPDCFALGSHNRNLAVAVGSLDNRCHLTEDTFFLQCFHQFSFKLVWNKITALCICANVQVVIDINPVSISDAVPESRFVAVACCTCLFRYVRCGRLAENRC